MGERGVKAPNSVYAMSIASITISLYVDKSVFKKWREK
jgi:hypothetical protein